MKAHGQICLFVYGVFGSFNGIFLRGLFDGKGNHFCQAVLLGVPLSFDVHDYCG